MSSAIPSDELEATLSNLKISTSSASASASPSPSRAPAAGKSNDKSANGKKKNGKKAAADVADSWEDEASDGSGSGTETEADSSSVTSPQAIAASGNSLHKTATASEGPLAPPPTPASPEYTGPYGNMDAHFAAAPTAVAAAAAAAAAATAAANPGSGSATPERRPDKTTAVAARMIAAGLGTRAPRRTEEEREYDRAMRDKERKRREREREEAAREKQRESEAKKAVWDD